MEVWLTTHSESAQDVCVINSVETVETIIEVSMEVMHDVVSMVLVYVVTTNKVSFPFEVMVEVTGTKMVVVTVDTT